MNILLVEDDSSSRLYLENLLEVNDYKFFSAANGIEGLNIFDEQKIDIVITDIQMPVMDGLELLEAIREKKSNTIVIITTAYGTENYAIQALQLGANNYLKKPVRGSDLIPLLKKYEIIINNRFSTDKLPGRLLERKFKLEFNTSINGIPKIVDRILSESACNYPDSDKINIELGLVELITNAVEHGNMGISNIEKKQAMENNTLDNLYNEKLADIKIREKKILIEFCRTPITCEWTIIDQGEGFDWKTLPDPTNEQNILELNGRGVFITNFLFDSVEYFGKGNIVKVKKNIDFID